MKKQKFVKNLADAEMIYVTPYGEHKNEAEEIYQITLESIESIHLKPYYIYSKPGPGFTVIIGMPGPDRIIYYLSDYGKTWAFSKEELRKEVLDEK